MGLVNSTQRLKFKTGTLKIGKVFKVGLLCEKNSRHNREGNIELNIQKDSIYLLLKDEYNLPDDIVFEWETIDTNEDNGRAPANIELNISVSNRPVKTPVKLIEKYHAVIGIGCPLFGRMHYQFNNMSGFVFNVLKPFGLFAFFFNSKNTTVETKYNNESFLIKTENNFYRKKYYNNSTFSGPEFREISYDTEDSRPIIYRTYIIFRKNAELINKNTQSNSSISQSNQTSNLSGNSTDSNTNTQSNSYSNNNNNITSRGRNRTFSRNRSTPILPFTTRINRTRPRTNRTYVPLHATHTSRNSRSVSSLLIIMIIAIILLVLLFLLTLM